MTMVRLYDRFDTTLTLRMWGKCISSKPDAFHDDAMDSLCVTATMNMASDMATTVHVNRALATRGEGTEVILDMSKSNVSKVYVNHAWANRSDGSVVALQGGTATIGVDALTNGAAAWQRNDLLRSAAAFYESADPSARTAKSRGMLAG